MRRKSGLAVAILASLVACAAEPLPLNSERIATQFGNYGIEIVAYDDGARHASLYSTHSGARICRTYAVVRFSGAAGELIEHQRVLAGDSIGSTFKAHDWQVSKITRYTGVIDLPPEQHPIKTLMQLTDARQLAMHVYRLNLRKDSQSVEYATIIEVHHPDYLDASQLQEIFPADMAEAPGEHELIGWRALIIDSDE